MPEFDDNPLRPATVEELAAAERAYRPSQKDGVRRPIIIAVTTCGLLLAGAGAFAVARTEQGPLMVQPRGDAAPFGVAYVDGFGEHSPKPAPVRPPNRVVITATPGPSTRADLPSPSSGLGGLLISDPSKTPDGVKPTSTGEEVKPVTSDLSVIYWVTSHRDSYIVYVWVHNSGVQPVPWQVQLTMPANTVLSRVWAATRVAQEGDTWTFQPSNGKSLAPERTYLFAYEGRHLDGGLKILGCAVVNGTCAPFGQ